MSRGELARSSAGALSHTDFDAAFADGAVFGTPDGSGQKEVTVTVYEAGRFATPSGRIIAAEPSQIQWAENQQPFTLSVRPGEYPVMLSAVDGRPVCLMVRFSDQTAVRWEMATRKGEHLTELPQGSFFGYGVDGGTGGFADAEAALRLVSVSDWFEDIVPSIDKAYAESADDQIGYFEYVLDLETGANLVGCRSGYGDGSYPSYWGFDDDGQVASLVTDFQVLVEAVSDTVTFPDFSTRIGESLAHDALTRVGAQRVQVLSNANPDLGFTLHHEGSEGLRAQLIGTDGTVLADTMMGGLSVFGGEPRHYEQQLRCSPAETQGAKMVISFSTGYRPLPRIR